MAKKIKIPDFHLSDIKLKHHLKKVKLQDAGAVIAFVSAVAVILLAACYVISRLASERAYNDKWRDYNDCGWA